MHRTPIVKYVLLLLLFLVSCTFLLKLKKSEVKNEGNGYFADEVVSHEDVELDANDIIYHKRNDKNFAPVVNEEYKVVFFMIAKCATSEWTRMFVRMMGSPNWCAHWVHKPEVNRLKFLHDYPIDQAQEIMTSPDWTRALFVRNPKDRVLSAFLDKVINGSKHFVSHECHNYGKKGDNKQEDCIAYHRDFGFFLKNVTTVLTNKHWMPMYDQIDEKWWPYINFIGKIQDLNEDATRLLKSIKSEKDGISAWDRWGTTGWGGDERNCEIKHTQSFLERNDARHETDAHEKLRKYYTPELEIFVEEQYKNDFNNPYFDFNPIELYPHNDASKLGLEGQTR